MVTGFLDIAHSDESLVERVFLPVIQVKKMVGEWAVARGYFLEEKSLGTGAWELTAGNRQALLTLKLTPDSPLATMISLNMKHGDVGSGHKVLSDLVQYLENQGKGTSQQPGDDVSSVLSQYSDLAACIMVYQETEPIQLSGIYLADRGAILTTAHDIEHVKGIVLTLRDGREFDGELVGIDKAKDLALIKVRDFPVHGLLPEYREEILNRGDSIYSIGCPLHRGISLRSGTVEGPRNMDGLILWQVNMDIEPGSSGSPVFDSSGNLIGVIKARLRGARGKGFIIPIDTVQGFLKDHDDSLSEGHRMPFHLPVFKNTPN